MRVIVPTKKIIEAIDKPIVKNVKRRRPIRERHGDFSNQDEVCYSCGSSNIYKAETQHDGREYLEEYNCKDCGARGILKYKVSFYDNVRYRTFYI